MPEISVIMPCYNTDGKMLESCIKSVLDQTFSDFELIIVDDGSKESYREIYKKDIFKDSRIKVILKENGGVSAARNYGLKHITGEYVIYVDSDDLLLPYFFEEALNTAKSKNADIVYGCNMHMNKYNEEYAANVTAEYEIAELSGEKISDLRPNMVGERIRYENGLIYIGRGPWTRLVKREIAVSTPFVEGLAICEDIIWNLEILEKAEKVCIVKKAWYLYNLGNISSATKRYNDKIISESMNGMNEVEKRLDMQKDSEFKAFADRCAEELKRIYNGFIGHRNFDLSGNDRKLIEKKLYSEKPWNVLASGRYFRLCSKKQKLKVMMYRSRIYFSVLRFKSSRNG